MQRWSRLRVSLPPAHVNIFCLCKGKTTTCTTPQKIEFCTDDNPQKLFRNEPNKPTMSPPQCVLVLHNDEHSTSIILGDGEQCTIPNSSIVIMRYGQTVTKSDGVAGITYTSGDVVDGLQCTNWNLPTTDAASVLCNPGPCPSTQAIGNDCSNIIDTNTCHNSYVKESDDTYKRCEVSSNACTIGSDNCLMDMSQPTACRKLSAAGKTCAWGVTRIFVDNDQVRIGVTTS